MTIGTLGTNASTSLQAMGAWSQVLTEADLAAIAASITNDRKFASILSGFGPGPTGVIGTGTTHTTTSLTAVTGVTGAAIGSIKLGDLVLAADIPPGTFVAAIAAGGATITLSQAATGSNVAENIAIVRPNPPGVGRAGQLLIPNRGILKVLPGDIVAVDNTGWPILVSGAAIGYAGSQWTLV